MGSLQLDPSGNFHVCFRFAGQRFKRSLHTEETKTANSLLGRVEENLRLVERGKLTNPEGADIPTFLLSDGQLSRPLDIPESVTLAALIERYEASMPRGAMEESTRYTIRVHTGHLKRVLGAGFKVKGLTRDDLQRYVNTRAKERGKRKKFLSPDHDPQGGHDPERDLVLGGCRGTRGAVSEQGPQVSRRVPRSRRSRPGTKSSGKSPAGTLTEEEQADLWDCLFLTLDEVSELLAFVKTAAQQPFIYPMFVLAAHTGARRSELVRSRLVDFDDDMVVIRERKRAKGKHTTRRVPLSSLASRRDAGVVQGPSGWAVRFLPACGGAVKEDAGEGRAGDSR